MRVRDLLAGIGPVDQKRMFGGLAFMIDGRMRCGVVGDRLVLRLGADGAAAALATEPAAAPMAVLKEHSTGRTMRNFVYLDEPAFRTDDQLRTWLARAASA